MFRENRDQTIVLLAILFFVVAVTGSFGYQYGYVNGKLECYESPARDEQEDS